jgi:hypothetical protein
MREALRWRRKELRAALEEGLTRLDLNSSYFWKSPLKLRLM